MPNDLQTLREVVEEAHSLLEVIPLPESGHDRIKAMIARSMMRSAVKLADRILSGDIPTPQPVSFTEDERPDGKLAERLREELSQQFI